MTSFVKIKDGVVVQKQPYPQEGFIEAPDTIVCGTLYIDDVFVEPLPPTPLPLTKLYRSTFIRRLTAVEATQLEIVLNSEEAYVRLLYGSVEWFDTSDALVMYLYMTLEAAYGAERATVLLTPEA